MVMPSDSSIDRAPDSFSCPKQTLQHLFSSAMVLCIKYQ